MTRFDVRGRIRKLRRRFGLPQVGKVRFGSLRRTTPISREFGYDRGQPVDRHYIEDFLDRHSPDIRGRVLEVGDDSYTRRYGADRVTTRDVLHVHAGNPQATFIGDLADGHSLPSDAFDCVVLTQTLHLIYDVRAAVRTLHRILRPGGVLLLTVPGITPIDSGEWGDTWFWSFTPAALRRLLYECFEAADVKLEVHGNVLAATSFLYGLSAHEIRPGELGFSDPLYPVIVAARAMKSTAGQGDVV